MSLKGFHIIFISLATLLCLFIVLWAFLLESSPALGMKIFGGTCALAAIILPIYGVRFYKKSQNI